MNIPGSIRDLVFPRVRPSAVKDIPPSRRRIDFLKAEFRGGLNLTVRDGEKWSTAKPGEILDAYVTGAVKPSGVIRIVSVELTDRAHLTDDICTINHDPRARTVDGLDEAMTNSYGVLWGPIVTLLRFEFFSGTAVFTDQAYAYRPPAREEAYRAIDGERAYQATKWDELDKYNRVEDFVGYMWNYFMIARSSEDETTSLDAVRKIASIGVACMETHGTVRRKGY